MAYSLNDIKVIHQKGIATKDRKYVTFDGQVFYGTPDGRLIKETKQVQKLSRGFAQISSRVTSTEVNVDTILNPGGGGSISTPPNVALSYFEFDPSIGALVPKDITFDTILTGNIFDLDISLDYISPGTGALDPLFEIDGGMITPKDI